MSNLALIRTSLERFLDSTIDATHAAQDVRKVRKGAYSAAVAAAIAAEGNAKAFAGVCDSIADDIRHNADGLAERIGAKPAKKDGTYRVPSAMMAARSTLTAAIQRRLALDDGGTPRAYNAIRRAVIEGNRKAKIRAETPDQRRRRLVVEGIRHVARRLRDMPDAETGQALEHVMALWGIVAPGVALPGTERARKGRPPKARAGKAREMKEAA